MREIVLIRDLDGMATERLSILPNARLLPGDQNEGNCGNATNDRHRLNELLVISHECVATPNQRDQNPNGWNVSVTVRNGLLANLHQANNRNERAEKPEPGDKQTWLALAQTQGQNRNDLNQKCRHSNKHRGPLLRVRIEEGQVGWPENLAQVTDKRDKDISEPIAQ